MYHSDKEKEKKKKRRVLLNSLDPKLNGVSALLI